MPVITPASAHNGASGVISRVAGIAANNAM
jgi:hypothetical protein